MKPFVELKSDVSPEVKAYFDRIDRDKKMMIDLMGMPPQENPVVRSRYGNWLLRVTKRFDADPEFGSVEWTIIVCGWKLVSVHRTATCGWIRFFGSSGPGIAWKDPVKHPLLFSERNGYTRRLQIGKWSVRYLSK